MCQYFTARTSRPLTLAQASFCLASGIEARQPGEAVMSPGLRKDMPPVEGPGEGGTDEHWPDSEADEEPSWPLKLRRCAAIRTTETRETVTSRSPMCECCGTNAS